MLERLIRAIEAAEYTVVVAGSQEHTLIFHGWDDDLEDEPPKYVIEYGPECRIEFGEDKQIEYRNGRFFLEVCEYPFQIVPLYNMELLMPSILSDIKGG
jgi:hypothetical protein